MAKNDVEFSLEVEFEAKLKGRTISHVRYMTKKEAQKYGWFNRPLVIFFEDGSYIMSSSDDEGNDGGALFTSIPDLDTIPVMR